MFSILYENLFFFYKTDAQINNFDIYRKWRGDKNNYKIKNKSHPLIIYPSHSRFCEFY